METFIFSIIGLAIEMVILGLIWVYILYPSYRRHMRDLGHPEFQDKEPDDKDNEVVIENKSSSSDYREELEFIQKRLKEIEEKKKRDSND